MTVPAYDPPIDSGVLDSRWWERKVDITESRPHTAADMSDNLFASGYEQHWPVY